MAIEIERKFLVSNIEEAITSATKSLEIQQGYISTNPDFTVRARIMGERAFITIKSRNKGCVRNEWEYEIPMDDALEIIQKPGIKKISKTRYFLNHANKQWEIDIFHDQLEGLALAEVELSSENEPISIPSFIGAEVTHDKRYFNSNIAQSLVIPE